MCNFEFIFGYRAKWSEGLTPHPPNKNFTKIRKKFHKHDSCVKTQISLSEERRMKFILPTGTIFVVSSDDWLTLVS